MITEANLCITDEASRLYPMPFHSEGHAVVERMVSTVKTMIGKVAADKPKQWHTYLDFIVWVIRRVLMKVWEWHPGLSCS